MKQTSTAHQKMSKQNMDYQDAIYLTPSSAKRTINLNMVMYAIVSKSHEETAEVEIPHWKTVNEKCTNDYLC